MRVQPEDIAQMDNGELFREIVANTLHMQGELVGEMVTRFAPYFPLGVLDAIWLQALVILACGTVGIELATMNRESSEYACAGASGGDDTPSEAPVATTVEHAGVGGAVGRLGLSLLRNTFSGYLLLSMSVGIASLGSAALIAIGS